MPSDLLTFVSHTQPNATVGMMWISSHDLHIVNSADIMRDFCELQLSLCVPFNQSRQL